MQCKKCHYMLWNVQSRECPQCGTAFLHSQYHFPRNNIQFACPHCNQRYIGTSAKGHLAPPEFDCQKCKSHISMDEMMVIPRASGPRHPGRPMRCVNCEYPLWRLPSRQCPECGTPFRPSDFEFVPTAVEFACPHCDKRYYGTGPGGHLSPSDFDCAGCNQRIHMDEMVLFPAPGVDEEKIGVPQAAWLDRKRRGFFMSWFSTIGSSLVAPGRLIKSVPVKSSLQSAWWFALLVHVPVVLFGLIVLVVMPVAFAFTFSGGRLGWVGSLGVGLGVALFCTFVGTSFIVALWGTVTHGMLRLITQPVAGARRTYQAICYSAGANIIAAVPICGAYTCAIWWMISAVIMVKEGQRVSGWKAAISVLMLPALCLLFAIAGDFRFHSSVSIEISTPTRQNEALQITESLLAYAEDRDGRFPNHAIQLIVDSYVSAGDFVTPATNTLTEDVSFAGSTLARFSLQSTASQTVTAAQAAADLPERTIAHRVGDFVFTYHGIDPETADPRLWLVVVSPDPDTNDTPIAGSPHRVGTLSGSVTEVKPAAMPTTLASQNRLRQSEGLPPLPDPTTVTHDAPAVAPKPEPDTSP